MKVGGEVGLKVKSFALGHTVVRIVGVGDGLSKGRDVNGAVGFFDGLMDGCKVDGEVVVDTEGFMVVIAVGFCDVSSVGNIDNVVEGTEDDDDG